VDGSKTFFAYFYLRVTTAYRYHVINGLTRPWLIPQTFKFGVYGHDELELKKVLASDCDDDRQPEIAICLPKPEIFINPERLQLILAFIIAVSGCRSLSQSLRVFQARHGHKPRFAVEILMLSVVAGCRSC